MQAVAEQSSVSPKVLVFRTRMGTPAPNPPELPIDPNRAPWNTHWYGNVSQVVTACLAGLALLVSGFNAYQIWSARKAEDNTQVFNFKVNKLIDDKLNPAVTAINGNIDTKLHPIDDQLRELNRAVGQIQGRLGIFAASQKKISDRLDQQASLAKLLDPSRVLATIRAEIQTAETSGKLLPASDLVDYKNAVLALPTSAYEYWTTAAAIINYQSKINQLSGEAPDPVKVSQTCLGLTAGTGGSNVFVSQMFSNCIVDLNTNDTFQNVIFRDSVIRYKGGPANLLNVTFVNCNFQLDLPPNTIPAKPNFLFALLDSPKQTSVKVR
jgi:hypothetical protein